MATTVAAATSALKTLAVAAYASDVQVTFTPPRFEDPKIVSILGWRDAQIDFAELGRDSPALEETYDIDVLIKYFSPGAKYEEVETIHTAACGMFSTLTEIVRDNSNLSGALGDGFALVAAVEGGTGVIPAVRGDPDADPYGVNPAEIEGYQMLIPCIVRCTSIM